MGEKIPTHRTTSLSLQPAVGTPGSNPAYWNRPHPLRRFLHVPDAVANLEARGVVPVDRARAGHLEDIALHFLSGCNAMFEAAPLETLEQVLEVTLPEKCGFVAEGAGMGAVLRDALSVRAHLFRTLLERHSRAFEYLIAVGAGWGLARVPWRAHSVLSNIDPVVAALAWDGRGFHDLYFKPGKALLAEKRHMSKDARRAYDCGLGRAVWFIASGNAEEAVRMVLGCPSERQPDLAAGLGLAMAYAGPCSTEDWDAVLNGLPGLRAPLAQGVCFAAEAHRCNGCAPVSCETAARVTCGLSASDAAIVAAETRPVLPRERRVAFAAFHDWREAISQAPSVSLARKDNRCSSN